MAVFRDKSKDVSLIKKEDDMSGLLMHKSVVQVTQLLSQRENNRGKGGCSGLQQITQAPKKYVGGDRRMFWLSSLFNLNRKRL